jgi:hypothetical protein
VVLDPKQTWVPGLREAARILDDALEEAQIELPSGQKTPHTGSRTSPLVVIHNVFSAEVHVTLNQVLQRLDELQLSEHEKTLAAEQLRELEAETNSGKRWPIIARSLETIKSIGIGLYRDLADANDAINASVPTPNTTLLVIFRSEIQSLRDLS